MKQDKLWEAMFKSKEVSKIKLIVLDRDGLINHNSSDQNSPYYYILHKDYVGLKDGVVEAFKRIKDLNIPVVLATKQLALSKGLMSMDELKEINATIEEMINFKFHRIYIEPKNKLKTNIFGNIIDDYKLHPGQILLIDDDEIQVTLGKVLGFKAVLSDNLLETIDGEFS